jgi:hypothetical protein
VRFVAIAILSACGGSPPQECRCADAEVIDAVPELKEPDFIVTIEGIAGPRAPSIGTFVSGRTEPADGVRERRGTIVVRTHRGIDSLFDGGVALIARPADERSLGGDGFTGDVERIIAIADVRDRVSVYVGLSFYTPGAAHANNELGCYTFDRGDPKPREDVVIVDGVEYDCRSRHGGVVELRAR